MDINLSSMRHITNSGYVPLSNASGGSAGEAGGFGEVLRKMQAGAGPNAAPASKTRLQTIDKNDKLYELCMELETILIKNLIKGMRSTIQKSNLIDSGFAGEMYEDMLYDEYAKDFAQNANLGFAAMAYRELAGLR